MIKKIGLLMLMAMIAFACGKSDGSVVPYVAVNFQISTSAASVSKLNTPGNAVVIPGYGVAGLLIYRRSDGSYAAYDRCSSYQPEKKCAVTIDDIGFTCTDPCSGSKFSLDDGTPVKAPASQSLRTYNAYVSNFQLFVTN